MSLIFSDAQCAVSLSSLTTRPTTPRGCHRSEKWGRIQRFAESLFDEIQLPASVSDESWSVVETWFPAGEPRSRLQPVSTRMKLTPFPS